MTDHFHYFEDGGLCYHTTFNTWVNVRGQEYDSWQPTLNADFEKPRQQYDPRHYDFSSEQWAGHKLLHAANREAIQDESDFPLVQCFDAAFDLLDKVGEEDSWMLQLECLDPHEPFRDPEIEARLLRAAVRVMIDHGVPEEIYTRFDVEGVRVVVEGV